MLGQGVGGRPLSNDGSLVDYGDSVFCLLMATSALLILWFRRPHAVLDVWLMVVMCAWLFDITLSGVVNAARFDLGFYAGRFYGLCAASFVLAVLLIDNVALQGQLARLLEKLRRQAASERSHHSERELSTLCEWNLREGHLELRRNLRAMYLALYAAELVIE